MPSQCGPHAPRATLPASAGGRPKAPLMAAPRADEQDQQDRVAPEPDRQAVRERDELRIDRFQETGDAGGELEPGDPQRPEAIRLQCHGDERREDRDIDDQRAAFNIHVHPAERCVDRDRRDASDDAHGSDDPFVTAATVECIAASQEQQGPKENRAHGANRPDQPKPVRSTRRAYATTRRSACAVLGHSSPSPKPTVRSPGMLLRVSTSATWQLAIPPRADTRPLVATTSSSNAAWVLAKPAPVT